MIQKINTIGSIVTQTGIDDLIVTPDLTTGVALLILGILIIPTYGAIKLKSPMTMIFVILQFSALTLTILVGVNLSIFWVTSMLTMVVLGISMAVGVTL
jgi:hypothetical protein